MAVLEMAAIAVTTGVAKYLVKQVLPEDWQDQIATEFVKYGVSWLFKDKRIDPVAEAIGKRIKAIYDYSKLEEKQKNVVLAEVSYSMGLAQTRAADLVKLDLDSGKLQRQLMDLRSIEVADLSTNEIALYGQMMRVASEGIIAVADQIAEYRQVVDGALLSGQREISEDVEKVLSKVREMSETGAVVGLETESEIDLEDAMSLLAEIPLDEIPAVRDLPPHSRMPYARNANFVGRQNELKELAAALKAGATAAVGQTQAVSGYGGIGKSQLAAEFVHRYGFFFAGGVFWISMADATEIEAEVAKCGGIDGMWLHPLFNTLPKPTQVSMVNRKWREPIPRLLIFDNCEHERLLSKWKPPTGGCRVLVTSRRGSWDPGLGVKLLPLETLPRSESIVLLQRLASRLDKDGAEAIASELGDFPLALDLAGRYMAIYGDAVSPQQYVDELRRQSVDHISLAGEKPAYSTTGHTMHVAKSFNLSLSRLDPVNEKDRRARELLARLAYIAPGDPITLEYQILIVADKWGIGESEELYRLLIDAISRLAELGLVERLEGGRIQIHRLLLSFVERAMGHPDIQEEVEKAILDKKYYEGVKKAFGSVRVLGQTDSKPLDEVSTIAQLLDHPITYRNYDVSKMLDSSPSKSLTGSDRTSRISGNDALIKYPKMFLLGKPGSGKTFYLQHLAMRAISRDIEKVPIFVPLRELAESRMELFPYIVQKFEVYRFSSPTEYVKKLLSGGNVLLLLDGLDEVNLAGAKRYWITQMLNEFFSEFSDCTIVITCRVAAADYSFAQFEYLEMADFDDEQIGRYVDLWFENDETKRVGCRRALLGKRENESVRQLAQLPLFLALLCLVYEERDEIPSERHEIYEEVTQALLRKWDARRNIVRDRVYEQLTLNRKQGLLAYLAARNFEDGTYFIRQEKIVSQIEKYLTSVPGLESPDGELVLQSIEAQHGILVERAVGNHSFLYLGIQEYFTAKYIVENESLDAIQDLMHHVGDDRWREVFLMVAGMLVDATPFCNAYIDAAEKLIADDSNLVSILEWAEHKGKYLTVDYKSVAVRAFLISRALDRARNLELAHRQRSSLSLAHKFDPDLRNAVAREWARDHARDLALTLASELDHELENALLLAHARYGFSDLDRASALTKAYKTSMKLAHLWQANDLIANLKELDTPPISNTPSDVDASSNWAIRFSEFLEPYRERWDPYLQMSVHVGEIEAFFDLNDKQIDSLKEYLKAIRFLLHCRQLAYTPDWATIEDSTLLPPEFL